MASPTNHRRLAAASCIPLSGRLGRWTTSSSGSLTASWSSASLEFVFTGTKLVLVIGENTERKDKENGGTQMLSILTGSTKQEALINQSNWRVADPQPCSEVLIFDGADREKTFVRIVLIDWASKFEIDAFILNEKATIEPYTSPVESQGNIPKFLVIGDSITAGLAVPVEEGGEPLPFGTLNTFPFVAERILIASKNTEIEMSMISYPGFCLVQPTKEEKDNGQRSGMAESFFWDNPWYNEDKPFATISPTVVIIELGTNDQSYKISPERFGLALIDLIKALKDWTISSFTHVWLIPPFPDTDTVYREINFEMPKYPKLLEDAFGKEIKFEICDLPDGLTVEDTVDGVHPRLYVHDTLGHKLADFAKAKYFGL